MPRPARAYRGHVARRGKVQEPEVVSITAAPRPHSDDLDARMARYLTSMLIRTVCVVLVVVIDHPVRWVFAVGAVGLPYVAVVMANASGPRRRQGPERPGDATPERSAPSLTATEEGSERRPRIVPGAAPDGAAQPADPRPGDDRMRRPAAP